MHGRKNINLIYIYVCLLLSLFLVSRFLCAFAKLQKVTINLIIPVRLPACPPVCLSVRMENLGSHWSVAVVKSCVIVVMVSIGVFFRFLDTVNPIHVHILLFLRIKQLRNLLNKTQNIFNRFLAASYFRYRWS